MFIGRWVLGPKAHGVIATVVRWNVWLVSCSGQMRQAVHEHVLGHLVVGIGIRVISPGFAFLHFGFVTQCDVPFASRSRCLIPFPL